MYLRIALFYKTISTFLDFVTYGNVNDHTKIAKTNFFTDKCFLKSYYVFKNISRIEDVAHCHILWKNIQKLKSFDSLRIYTEKIYRATR